MLYQVKTVNGQKTKIPLSDPAPTGNPIGTIISTYKKIQPKNYLYCDGSFFDETLYPALYLYLGSNQLPDYRECVQVGAEQNTTDTITDHDVYAQGEFKDDQSQKITGRVSAANGTTFGWNSSGALYPASDQAYAGSSSGGRGATEIILDTSRNVRTGTTTHGKQKAVYYYIKAVDGVDISDEDTFLNTVKDYVDEKNSYSTTEQPTGGTWVDGKPIYKKTFTFGAIGTNQSYPISTSDIDIDTVIKGEGCCNNGVPIVYADRTTDGIMCWYWSANQVVIFTGTTRSVTSGAITLYYTKTTD